MKKIKLFIAAFAFAIFGISALVPVGSASALDPLKDVCSGNNTGSQI